MIKKEAIEYNILYKYQVSTCACMRASVIMLLF